MIRVVPWVKIGENKLRSGLTVVIAVVVVLGIFRKGVGNREI